MVACASFQMTVHYFGISIPQLVRWVLGDSGRPVQDKTGLTGKYDVTIERPVPEGAGTPEVRPVETSAGEIENQLGLKLEPANGQVESLVIDHLERPSPN
jgi:bla regulator protein BlaR1